MIVCGHTPKRSAASAAVENSNPCSIQIRVLLRLRWFSLRDTHAQLLGSYPFLLSIRSMV